MNSPINHQEEFDTRASLYALDMLSPYEARMVDDYLLSEATNEEIAELNDFKEIVAHLAFDSASAQPSPDVRAQVLARIAADSKPAQSNNDGKPEIIRPTIDIRFDEIEWEELTKGIFFKNLYFDKKKNSLTTLYKMLPGTSIPRHGHSGVEQCMIVEGDFRVGDKTYGPGDFQAVFEGSIHDNLWTETGAVLLIVSQPEYRMS